MKSIGRGMNPSKGVAWGRVSQKTAIRLRNLNVRMIPLTSGFAVFLLLQCSLVLDFFAAFLHDVFDSREKNIKKNNCNTGINGRANCKSDGSNRAQRDSHAIPKGNYDQRVDNQNRELYLPLKPKSNYSIPSNQLTDTFKMRASSRSS